MKSKRLKPEWQGENGWTGWIQPVKRGYLMSCCDCGLVHRLDFRVKNNRAQFRAQRAPQYTNRERNRGKQRKLLCRLFGCSLRATTSRGMAGDCVCIRCDRKVTGLKWPPQKGDFK